MAAVQNYERWLCGNKIFERDELSLSGDEDIGEIGGGLSGTNDIEKSDTGIAAGSYADDRWCRGTVL